MLYNSFVFAGITWIGRVAIFFIIWFAKTNQKIWTSLKWLPQKITFDFVLPTHKSILFSFFLISSSRVSMTPIVFYFAWRGDTLRPWKAQSVCERAASTGKSFCLADCACAVARDLRHLNDQCACSAVTRKRGAVHFPCQRSIIAALPACY